MTRNALNFIVDGISALVILGLVGTGLINRFVLPPGSGNRLAVWSLGRHDWGDMHFWLAGAGAGMLLVHIALHWQWVCTTAARIMRPWSPTRIQPSPLTRNLAGAAVLALLIGSGIAFVRVAQASVVQTTALEGRGGPWWAEDQESSAADDVPTRGNQGIRGSMTLAEAADSLGITIQSLRERLNLPAEVDANRRLGQLRQQYGFTMTDVRGAARATTHD